MTVAVSPTGERALSTRNLIHRRREEECIPEQPRRRRAALRECRRRRDPDRERESPAVPGAEARLNGSILAARRSADRNNVVAVHVKSREAWQRPHAACALKELSRNPRDSAGTCCVESMERAEAMNRTTTTLFFEGAGHDSIYADIGGPAAESRPLLGAMAYRSDKISCPAPNGHRCR